MPVTPTSIESSEEANMPFGPPKHETLFMLGGTLLLFLLYLWTLCPTLHWLDSGELITGAFHLSVPHPPGEPAWVLFSKALLLLPIGDLAYRGNLSSALAGALCFPCTYWMLVAWMPKKPAPRSTYWALLITSLAPCLTYPLWVQAVRAEVYAHHLALTLGTLAALGHSGVKNPRMWMLSGLLGGLTAAIHPLLAALSLGPAIFMTAWLRGLPRGIALGVTASTALLGLSSYMMLPIRTAAHATMPWGHPDTASRFMDVLLARIFHHNFSPPTSESMWLNLNTLAESITYSTGWTIPIAALGGCIVLLIQKNWALLTLSLAIIASTFWSIIPQNLVFATNIDLHGYLTIVHVIIWAQMAILVIAICSLTWANKAPFAQFLPAFILLFFAASAAIVQGPDASRAGNKMARQHAQIALDSSPQGALVITSGNNTMFGIIYMREVEGWRPDLQVVHRTLAGHDWYQKFRQETPRPITYKRLGLALGNPQDWLSFGTHVFVEARERDLRYADWLCPTGPDPGWGFYRFIPQGKCPQAWRNSPAPGLANLWEAHPGDIESRLVQGFAAQIGQQYRREYARLNAEP